MTALLRACDDPAFPACPVLVLSNRPDAAGLASASASGVLSLAIDHKDFGADREAFERKLDEALLEAGAEIIALAGFMRVLTPWFVRRWAGRLINIHPSLLPKYPGLGTHQRAIDAGDSEAGCTVHFVTETVDEGEIIAQARVPVLSDDTAETLAARILPEEHKLYPEALKRVCQ